MFICGDFTILFGSSIIWHWWHWWWPRIINNFDNVWYFWQIIIYDNKFGGRTPILWTSLWYFIEISSYWCFLSLMLSIFIDSNSFTRIFTFMLFNSFSNEPFYQIKFLLCCYFINLLTNLLTIPWSHWSFWQFLQGRIGYQWIKWILEIFNWLVFCRNRFQFRNWLKPILTVIYYLTVISCIKISIKLLITIDNVQSLIWAKFFIARMSIPFVIRRIGFDFLLYHRCR